MKYLPIGILTLVLCGCTTAQQQQARQAAAQTLDGLCNNLSVADAAAQNALVAANANATAFRVERDAVLTIATLCNNRPVNNPGAALIVASTAFAAIVAAEARR